MAVDKNHNHDHEHEHFVVPLKYYFYTIAALLFLTVMTVMASYMSFGSTFANLMVAMAIACGKASLVMMIFMGLRWDSLLNRGAILGTVVALAVFIWLTASDLWHREPEKFITVKLPPASVSMDDIKKFENEGIEARVTRGKELFSGNCATCHGPEGKGDGVAGASLNPKPRNFLDPNAVWKNGASVRSIYVTVTEGIKGTGMAGFPSLSPEDRFALTHFVRSISAVKQEKGTADSQFLKVLETADGIGAGAVAKESIPVDLAIELLVKERSNSN